MSRFASPKTAQILAERIAQCERSSAPVAQFCQSIGCSPTSFYQWKRKLAAKPQATAFLRVQTSDSTKVSIEIKLPSGISILVPVSAVESISAILTPRLAMYLESIITHMLRGTAKTEEMLPDRWKAAHPEAVREYHEQERRDKADTAVLQAERRRVRAELRKGK